MQTLWWARWWAGVPRTLLLPAVLGWWSVMGSVFASRFADDARPLDGWGVALLLVGPVALVFRRAYRPAALAVAAAATVVFLLLGFPFGPVFLPVLAAFASTVVGGYRVHAYVIAALTYLAVTTVALVRTEWSATVWTGVGFWLAVLAAVAALGELVRARRERRAEAAATRAETERRQAAQERLRIAQELHDVLGHHVSLINVQAGVALYLLDSEPADPEQARAALTAIKRSSKDLLREMRSTLGVLRAVDEPAAHHPVPGVDRLPALADEVRAAGLPVELVVTGERRDLPTGVDLAAYRIVQEALTNVRRHAGAATARVDLSFADDGVSVQIDDDGAGPAASTGDGNGLAGMRERATALGGSLTAGPGPEGGFRVVAVLPTVTGEERA